MYSLIERFERTIERAKPPNAESNAVVGNTSERDRIVSYHGSLHGSLLLQQGMDEREGASQAKSNQSRAQILLRKRLSFHHERRRRRRP